MSDAVREAIEVVDRLRSPGGCPWDREQTHRSLARYLLEESYETLEAIETDDAALLREELGDLLLQVLIHARIAAEATDPAQRFDIDDVAGDLAAKMIRRHPHVFGDVVAEDADAVVANWEELKAAEKARTSVTDGVPPALPALALGSKLVSRARRAGIDVTVPTAPEDIGARLFALVTEAVERDVDPETALREHVRLYRDAIRAVEAGAAEEALHGQD